MLLPGPSSWRLGYSTRVTSINVSITTAMRPAKRGSGNRRHRTTGYRQRVSESQPALEKPPAGPSRPELILNRAVSQHRHLGWQPGRAHGSRTLNLPGDEFVHLIVASPNAPGRYLSCSTCDLIQRLCRKRVDISSQIWYDGRRLASHKRSLVTKNVKDIRIHDEKIHNG